MAPRETEGGKRGPWKSLLCFWKAHCFILQNCSVYRRMILFCEISIVKGPWKISVWIPICNILSETLAKSGVVFFKSSLATFSGLKWDVCGANRAFNYFVVYASSHLPGWSALTRGLEAFWNNLSQFINCPRLAVSNIPCVALSLGT